MRIIFSGLFLLTGILYALAQAPCGIINSYFEITSIDTCNNLMYSNTKGLSKGERVVIMQMKGASVNTGNNASFGDITAMNSAGNYEFNVVSDVINDTGIVFSFKFRNTYQAGMGLQLIRFPVYTKPVINCALTCKAWDGVTGGVLVLFATDTITLRAPVDVSKKGFRNVLPINAGNCLPLPYTDYFTTAATKLGARKGEGVVVSSSAYECGRGKLANAGGGGNEHNSGGGGGSNGGAGGNGGERIKNLLSCPGNYPGIGGTSLSAWYGLPQSRVFMGGSGGCGHENNNYTDTSGAGGGIVFIVGKVVRCFTGDSVKANGESVTGYCGEDGGSGGGAGGTILIKTDTILGTLTLSACGGDGEWVDNGGKAECYGTGGGGSGGVISLNATVTFANVNFLVKGGKAGITYNSINACNNTPNNATDGSTGKILLSYVYNESATIFRRFTVDAGKDITLCKGESAQLSADKGKTWEWQPPLYLSNNAIKNPVAKPDTTTTYVLRASDSCSIAYDTITVFVLPLPVLTRSKDTSICYGDTVQLFVSGGTNYVWSPPVAIDSINSSHPKVWPSSTTRYIVTSTLGNCTARDTIKVTVVNHPVVTVSNDTVLCEGGQVMLQAGGAVRYTWSPGTYLSDSTSASPVCKPGRDIKYTVTGYNATGCASTATVQVMLKTCLDSDIVVIPNVFTPNKDMVNDVFEIDAKGLKNLSVQVFNRWGQLLYSSTDLHFAWDGGNSPNGVYYYAIHYTTATGKKVERKGSLTLIRDE